MERYNEYKDSGVQWLGEIPSHWEVVRLKSVIKDSQSGVWGEDPKHDGSDTLCLRVADFNYNNGYLKEDNLTYRNYGKELSSNKQLQMRDLLLEKSGGGDLYPVGRVVRYNFNGIVATCSNFIQKLTPRDNVDSDFIYYLFRTMYYLKVNGLYYNQTTGIQNLKVKEYLSQTVFLPPLSEQQAIASYLDTATAKIDEAISQQQKMIDLLNERKQIIINNAVTKGLNPDAPMKDSGVDWIGEIPEHWELMQYRHLFYNLDKLRQPISADKRSRNNPQYDYYGASGVIDKIDYYNVENKVLLIGEDGANLLLRNLPLIYKAEGKFWVNNHAHILKPIKDDYDFMAYVMEAADYTLFITGSAQPKLSQSNLNAVKLPIPPLEEQKSIVDYLAQRTEKIDLAIVNATKLISLLQERKQIIINDVVTGKVKVL